MAILPTNGRQFTKSIADTRVSLWSIAPSANPVRQQYSLYILRPPHPCCPSLILSQYIQTDSFGCFYHRVQYEYVDHFTSKIRSKLNILILQKLPPYFNPFRLPSSRGVCSSDAIAPAFPGTKICLACPGRQKRGEKPDRENERSPKELDSAVTTANGAIFQRSGKAEARRSKSQLRPVCECPQDEAFRGG